MGCLNMDLEVDAGFCERPKESIFSHDKAR